MKLYFGKLSKAYPEQFTENFYAAGEESSSWYGGIRPGDYVFPIFEGKISKLWKVREYGNKTNRIGIDNTGVVFFDTIKTYTKSYPLADEFLRYKFFDLDLNLLNKSAKSVKNFGFLEIKTLANCPSPENIIIENNIRKIWIALSGNNEINPNENDIRILLDNYENMNIKDIEIFIDGNFNRYKTMWELYIEKNSTSERYSVKKLLEYAKSDNAPNKESFLNALLEELKDKGYFLVTNPIALYDNLLVGRKVSKPSKLKDAEIINLVNAEIETVTDIDTSEYIRFVELLENNPNLILYGPPGTGKTFLSQRIVEAFDFKKNLVFKEFSEIESENRIRFITFHQAYSYEEFVEGIRPILNRNESESEEGNLKYRVEDGVLKQLADSASKQEINKGIAADPSYQITDSSQIWKVSLGQKNIENRVYKACKKNNEIAIGWVSEQSLEGKEYDEIYSLLSATRTEKEPKPINDASSTNALVNEMKFGDIVLIYDSPTSIRDIGVITSNYKYVSDDENPYHHRRKVKWLKEFENPFDIYEMNRKTRLTLKTIYPLDNITFSDLRDIIYSNEVNGQENQNHMPYYLIIDEINRGNVSKIFGELITLIEKDKRENVKCYLPYSQKPFKLPSNIYIIGTMNTADRSLATIDTALRRRFSFYEVEPDPLIYTKVSMSRMVNDKVDLEELLRKINIKIAKKLDRDHRIGHSYFMEIQSLKQLYLIWYYKIIPLLFEYFYNDIESIKSIIGTEFFDDNLNVKSLDYSSGETISAFEQALINIYKANG